MKYILMILKTKDRLHKRQTSNPQNSFKMWKIVGEEVENTGKEKKKKLLTRITCKVPFLLTQSA